MPLTKIGRFLTLLFVGLLPWSVVIAVFGADKLGIEPIRYFKEILLVAMVIVWGFSFLKKKISYKLDILDWLIIAYCGVLLIVSIFNHASLSALAFGLRYDVGYLLTFMLLRRALPEWGVSFNDIARVFLISGGTMLILSLVVRYIIHEDFLTLLGFSPNASVWDGSGPPPIFHGIAGAGVIRFQGLLEGPNQMAFFLLVYIGTYLQSMFYKKKYFVLNISILLVLILCLLMTYSRSSYIAFALGSVYLFFRFGFVKLRKFKNKKKKSYTRGIVMLLVIVLIGMTGAVLFGGRIQEIFGRHASTSGHFERMHVGYLRFLEHPWGSGLAQAGPASRVVAPVDDAPLDPTTLDQKFIHLFQVFKERNADFEFSTATYYIPESWYIQQLIEGGFLALLLLVSIFGIILLYLKQYPWILASFLGVMVINFFLHSFESVHSAFILFTILAALIPVTDKKIFSPFFLGK